VVEALELGVHHLFGQGVVLPWEQAEGLQAGCVHQAAHTAMPGPDVGHHLGDRLGVADVAGNVFDRRGSLSDPLRRPPELTIVRDLSEALLQVAGAILGIRAMQEVQNLGLGVGERVICHGQVGQRLGVVET